MSVIVKGVDFPSHCGDCFAVYETEGAYHDYCQAAGYETDVKEFIYRKERPAWCPLEPCREVEDRR